MRAELFHAEERTVPGSHAVQIDIVTDVSEKRSGYIFRVQQSKNSSSTTILGMPGLKMERLRASETSQFTSPEGVTSRKNVPSSAPLCEHRKTIKIWRDNSFVGIVRRSQRNLPNTERLNQEDIRQ